jgi:hypothetical protein
MSSSAAQTLLLRVQVVDVQSATLNLHLPTFLPAKDLSQRIARDAGLQAHWPDGSRRQYWLRARGRILDSDETLASLAIVPHELLHLLPEPPEDTNVVEQEHLIDEPPPAVGGNTQLALALVSTLVWSVLWGISLTTPHGLLVSLFGGFSLGALSSTVGHHLIELDSRSVKKALSALGITLITIPLVVVPGISLGLPVGDLVSGNLAGIAAAFIGALVGWVAWWEAVEPLPESVRNQEGISTASDAHALPSCTLCGGSVEESVKASCPYGCEKVFHTGCFQARASLNKDEDNCGLCGAMLA